MAGAITTTARGAWAGAKAVAARATPSAAVTWNGSPLGGAAPRGGDERATARVVEGTPGSSRAGAPPPTGRRAVPPRPDPG